MIKFSFRKRFVSFMFIVGLLSAFLTVGGHTSVATEMPIVDLEKTEVVEFDKAPIDIQNHLSDEGFGEGDEVYRTVVPQNNGEVKSIAPRFVNALEIWASSRKINNTTGYTAYTVVSTNSAMYRLDVNAKFGSKAHTMGVNLPNRYDYSGGIYIYYSGKKEYRSIRVAAQVKNTYGLGSVSCGAGGLTLGN